MTTSGAIALQAAGALYYTCLLVLLHATIHVAVGSSLAASSEPRYITFLRAPGAWGAITPAKPFGDQCPDNGCVTEWVPTSCTEQTFQSILQTLGLNGTENSHMRPAVKILFNINNISVDVLSSTVSNCLAMSAKTKVPILLAFQGQWWWWGSGLWNWYDPDQPGYDPHNKNNVERFSWAEGTELKISWHDWATIVRQEPAQNIHSPKVRQMTVRNLQVAVDKLRPSGWVVRAKQAAVCMGMRPQSLSAVSIHPSASLF